eukprot:1156823-Pelagomonas_calceolata.AAC.5
MTFLQLEESSRNNGVTVLTILVVADATLIDYPIKPIKLGLTTANYFYSLDRTVKTIPKFNCHAIQI